MIPDLLPHEARPVVLLGYVGVMDDALLLVMYGGATMNKRSPTGLF
jgi:hypothetical protein